jgi:Flp pilus assembly protein TadB
VAGGALVIIEVLLGAFCGFGLYITVRALVPSRPGAAAQVARIDALRARGQFGAPAATAHSWQERLGFSIAEFYARRGWEQRSVRADLTLLERSWQQFLVTKFALAVGGFLVGPLLFGVAWLWGLHVTPLVPVWLAVGFAALFFILPDLEVRRDAAAKRADFRRVVAAYLDLVSMNLAGGRGLPEALMSAAEVSDGWALRRLRDCLTDARLAGVPQWTALGELGTELGLKELTDLGAALNLVADDGAKVRASLSSRAETMRRREIAEMEGKAGARSQSMLVAQMLLAAGFLIFILYPATVRIFQLR